MINSSLDVQVGQQEGVVVPCTWDFHWVGIPEQRGGCRMRSENHTFQNIIAGAGQRLRYALNLRHFEEGLMKGHMSHAKSQKSIRDGIYLHTLRQEESSWKHNKAWQGLDWPILGAKTSASPQGTNVLHSFAHRGTKAAQSDHLRWKMACVVPKLGRNIGLWRSWTVSSMTTRLREWAKTHVTISTDWSSQAECWFSALAYPVLCFFGVQL